MTRGTSLTRHVAFLRGINVGGHRIKMDRLAELFTALGLPRVTTFIASGNVLFDALASKSAALETQIQQHLPTALGYEVDTFIRSIDELFDIVAFDAFDPPDGHTLHVGFLRRPLDADATRTLLAHQTAMDAFIVRGREFFWLCRGKSMESLVPWPKLARDPRFRSTLRNMTMLRKLAAQCAT